MDGKRKGILIFAAAILSIGLLLGAQGAKAAAPTMTAVTADTNHDGTVDRITITFSEAVKIADGNAGDGLPSLALGNGCAIANADYANASTTSLALSGLTGCTAGNTAITPLVTYTAVANCTTSGAICDAAGANQMAAAAITSADGAAPVALSAAYKDINSDGKVDRIDVTYSENIAGSVFNAGEWSLPANPHSLAISSGTFSGTDALLAVSGAPAGNTALDATAVKYTAGTGVTDSINPAVTSAAISLGDKAWPIILTAVDQSANSLDGGANIPANANIIVSFSEPMDTTSLDSASEWTISPDPAFWSLPVWSNSNKTVTMSHTSTFTAGNVETVTFSAPLAVSGNGAADKALQNTPVAAAVGNPFSFTVAGGIAPSPSPSPSTDVSAYWSTVNASPVILIADGLQTATVNVVAKNSVGVVLAKKAITISSGRGASDTILPAGSVTTGANGVASFTVSSTTVGKAVIAAKVGDLAIAQTAQINFLPIGSQIGNPTTPDENSGVILYRIPGDPRVYVIKNNKRHWIKNPKEFEDSGYDWKKIQEVSAAILAKYPDAEPLVSDLLRAIGDTRVYLIKDGRKQWIRTAEDFNAAGYDWNNIQNVTPDVLTSYSDAQLADALVKIVNAMNLRVRSADSTQGAVLDTVKNSEVYQVIEKKNGWYKIKTKGGKHGWISGKYAKEENDNDEDED